MNLDKLSFIHTFWWPTNGRAGNENTRSAFIVSNGTPPAHCVFAYCVRCSNSWFCVARVHRLFLQENAQFYSLGFYCLNTFKERKMLWWEIVVYELGQCMPMFYFSSQNKTYAFVDLYHYAIPTLLIPHPSWSIL